MCTIELSTGLVREEVRGLFILGILTEEEKSSTESWAHQVDPGSNPSPASV